MLATWILAVFLSRHLTLTVPLSTKYNYSVIGCWQNLHPTQGEGGATSLMGQKTQTSLYLFPFSPNGLSVSWIFFDKYHN